MTPATACRALLLTALSAGSLGLAAQTPDRAARAWAASCNTCHGPGGQSQGGIPPIAGRDAQTLYRTLIEFKTGQRPAATVMHQHTKGYTDEELLRIAQVFAASPAK